MKKSVKHKKTAVCAAAQPDSAGLIAQLQEQVSRVERKIDALTSSLAEKLAAIKHVAATQVQQQKPTVMNVPVAPQAQQQSTPQAPRQQAQPVVSAARSADVNRINGIQDRPFFKAICADCTSACEVPFKPSGTRPVYCKECFKKRKFGNGAVKAHIEPKPAIIQPVPAQQLTQAVTETAVSKKAAPASRSAKKKTASRKR